MGGVTAIEDITHAAEDVKMDVRDGAAGESKQPEAEARGASTSAAEEEEDEGCAFCAFMKGGGCKTAFVAWEKCVDMYRENDEDFSRKCFQYTMDLQTCMTKNREYYAPMLDEEEKYAEEQTAAMKAAEAAEGTAPAAAPAQTESSSGPLVRSQCS